MKLKTWIIAIACLVIGFSSATIIQSRAPKKETFGIPIQDVDNEKVVTRWVYAYLEAHTAALNTKDKIKNYQIKSIDFNVLGPPESQSLKIRLELDVFAEKQPKTLFETQPIYRDSETERPYYAYDIIVYFDEIDGRLRYDKDISMTGYQKNMHDQSKVEEDEDTLSDLYRIDDMNLKIKFKEEWIETPVPSDSFNRLHKNWYLHDQKLLIQGDRIAILYAEDSETYFIQSLDGGKTWENKVLMDQGDIGHVSYGSIHFEENHAYVVLLNYVAINAEVMTILESKDNGVTWQRGETKNRNVKIQSVSMLDDVLYIAKKEDDSLYRYTSYDSEEQKIELPEGTLKNTTKYTENLGWRDIYRQVEAPSKESGSLQLLLTQGENWDHDRNSQAVYMSEDKGLTWKFDHFMYPEIKKPSKN